jgi:hypothetical protein
MTTLKKLAAGFVISGAFIAHAYAQVPVIDGANLQQSTEINKTTKEILDTDKKIDDQTKQILEAVTGNRTDASGAAGTATGGGFQFGQAPSFSQILGGGGMQFGGLPSEFQQIASGIINGMKLVKELKSMAEGGGKTSNQAGYEALLNTAASLAGTVSGSQQAVSARTQAFTGVGSKIGQEKDIKGAIALNSQIGVETAQTINEAVGAVTTLNAAEQAKLMKRLAEESGTLDLLSND